MSEATVAPVAAWALSTLGTALAVAYGRRRGLLDLPGRRRSHALPTPRGGGLGPLVAFVLVAGFLWWSGPADSVALLGIGAGLLGIAGIGWWDDHTPLPASTRLAVHALSAVLIVVALASWLPALAGGLLLLGLAALLLVVAVNVCNFMDGINGLAASQCLICAVAVALLAEQSGESLLAMTSWVLAMSSLGFLPFNFPRARIFLGDVGSGFLGATLGLLLLVAAWRGVAPWYALLLLPSAFAIDAGMTLATRILRRRHWYRAHREHLYQWLVRSGMSHARVTFIYALWSLGVGALVIWQQGNPWMPVIAGMIMLGAAIIWWIGKLGLLRRAAAGLHR